MNTHPAMPRTACTNPGIQGLTLQLLIRSSSLTQSCQAWHSKLSQLQPSVLKRTPFLFQLLAFCQCPDFQKSYPTPSPPSISSNSSKT